MIKLQLQSNLFIFNFHIVQKKCWDNNIQPKKNNVNRKKSVERPQGYKCQRSNRVKRYERVQYRIHAETQLFPCCHVGWVSLLDSAYSQMLNSSSHRHLPKRLSRLYRLSTLFLSTLILRCWHSLHSHLCMF